MAAFFDGRSARRREARLAFEAEALTILDEAGGTLARWPYASLRSAEGIVAGRPATIASTQAPDARLRLVESEAIDRLRAAAPQLSRRGDALSWPALAAAAAAAATVLAGLYYGLPLAARPLAKLVPIEWEDALGRQVLAAHGAGGACARTAGVAALHELSRPLIEASGFAPGFRITVADDPRVNAFAAPGGRIVLFRGLLEEAHTPHEVAGVLAHEMGHAMERHPTAAALRLLGVRVVADGLFGDGSAVVSALANTGGLLLALSYSRADEREADRIALEILDRAGVSPSGLAQFFTRLAEEQDGLALPEYASSHPAPRERAALFAGEAPREPLLSDAEWRALVAICD